MREIAGAVAALGIASCTSLARVEHVWCVVGENTLSVELTGEALNSAPEGFGIDDVATPVGEGKIVELTIEFRDSKSNIEKANGVARRYREALEQSGAHVFDESDPKCGK